MHEIIKVTHTQSLKDYVESFLRNGSHEQELHERHKGHLLEFSVSILQIFLRYTVYINWSSNIQQIIGSNEIEVVETRDFHDPQDGKIIIESKISAHKQLIVGKITRIIEDRTGGCAEEITIDISIQVQM